MMFCFGDYVLDTARRDLRRADEVIAVEPKVYEVLLYLIEHRDRVVSRDKLIEQCWADTYVGNETLNRCMSRVRQAIGQTRRGARLIQTVYGTGYRFVGQVTELDPAPTPETAPVGLAQQLTPVALQRPSRLPSPDSQATPTHKTAVPSAPARSKPMKPPSTIAERRQLTVLSCSLIDANWMLAELDPEDLHIMLQEFRATCLPIIAQYEGHVAQYLDAGLVVYFGYPQGHEDNAQRAIRSALQIVESFTQADARHPDTAPRLAVRVGIHTGDVITEPGDASGAEPPLAVGAAASVAAAVRELARPQTVVISADTAQFGRGVF